ncbi:unnamed protein product [Calypogeia fissa]
MATAKRKLMHLAAILVLLVWNNCNGNNGPAGVVAVPAVIVMGDSTVDVGVNNNIPTVFKANWPPYGRDFPGQQATGRFCDGMLIPDFIAQRLGHQAPFQLAFNDPNAKGAVLLQGINTASSGGGYWDNTGSGLCFSLSQQVEWISQWKGNVTLLVGEASAASITEQAVFTLSTGSNDWLNSYFVNPSNMQKYTPSQYTDLLIGFLQNRLQDLYNLGARRFAVVSLPPIGCIPLETLLHNTNGKCADDLNNAAVTFNTALQSLLSSLQGSMAGTTFVYLDAFTQLYDAFNNPSQFGIVHSPTADACCHFVGSVPAAGVLCNGDSPVCANADEYLFWDAFHPTQFFNQKVADVFYGILSSAMGF